MLTFMSDMIYGPSKKWVVYIKIINTPSLNSLQKLLSRVWYTISIMKVLILYRPHSEHGRTVEEYVHEFQTRNREHKLEMIDVETRDGSATASLYDVMQYPAILVTQDDGYLQRCWLGDTLPLMDEVASYARV